LCWSDSELIRQALGVDAADQFHGDVDIPIGSASYDGRRQVVSLHHPHRIAAPAQANSNVGLGSKVHFVGVYTDQKHHIGWAGSRPSNSERRVVGSKKRSSVTRRCVGGAEPDPRPDAAVVGKDGRTSGAIITCGILRGADIGADANAQRRAREASVRF
jgi:hypothetical protein